MEKFTFINTVIRIKGTFKIILRVKYMDNILELKTINDLRKMNFFIPSYQRGYRWGEKEVTDLLNDVSEFTPKQIDDADKKTWYCLQPIVVKVKSKQHDTIDEKQYEVIDGQQRLTTIYLVLYYLNQLYTEEHREPLFELKYETSTLYILKLRI